VAVVTSITSASRGSVLVIPGEPFAAARERADHKLDELATAFLSLVG
jgi:hypothetical protein